jgi:ubiquinone/menaquinone biosynthesis C-methylase UbiE
MNYDATEIAVTYDRGRDHGPEFLDLWMDVVAAHVKAQTIKTILDLGCGTGRFTEALRARFDADVIGIDPSKKMLEQARSKLPDGKGAISHASRIRYEPGRGESIPRPDNSVDLVFMSMVFHHFDNPALAARECRRVLREGATVLVRTGTRERISSYPYVDFFPESRAILKEVLPANAFVREVFEAAGFRMVTLELVTQEIAPSYVAYAEKLAAGADSVLASLSRRDFDAGMRALRAHAAHSDGKPVFEPIDVFVFR